MRPSESFVGQSVRSLQTMLRVISEANGEIPTVVPDGFFGQATANSVSTFQRLHGIPVTGVVDEQTWAVLYQEYDDALIRIGPAQPIEVIFDPDQVFQRGDRSPYLYLLQGMLQALADVYPILSPPVSSGIMDDATSVALAGFQALAGLPPTGELDRVTWKYLTHHFALVANHQSPYL